MKTPQELTDIYYNTDGMNLVDLIIQSQNEAYNEALIDVLKGAEEQNDHGLTYDTVDREYIESLFKK
jgi:hypothetical protein